MVNVNFIYIVGLDTIDMGGQVIMFQTLVLLFLFVGSYSLQGRDIQSSKDNFPQWENLECEVSHT